MKGWFGMGSLDNSIKAHSGNYSIRTDAEFQYSFGFESTVSEISKKPLKKIRATVWMYSKLKDCNGEFCVQILNTAGENKLWKSKLFQEVIKSEGKWTKVIIETDIPRDALTPENKVKVFLWNKGSVPVYADDFELVFTE
ncbi:MAG: hypothetical protein IPP32_04465 [Bacteroidetes bacterium]|nr:hypothetical protein [Bacteroidota bacterium]